MNMRVENHRIVTIRYQMWNSAGELLLDTMVGEPVTFLYGSGQILPPLEEPLAGMMKGERKSFSLSEEDAPGLGDVYTFDVQVENIASAANGLASDISPEPACGTDCDCHYSS